MPRKTRVRLAAEYLEDRTQPAHLSLGLAELLTVQPLLTVETAVLSTQRPAARAPSNANSEPAAIVIVFGPAESISFVIEPAAAAKPIPTSAGSVLPVSAAPGGVESAGVAASAASARGVPATSAAAGAVASILLPPDANPQPATPANIPPALATASSPGVLALAPAQASSIPSTYSALTTPVGGVNGVALAVAPAPHEVDALPPAGPSVGVAPPPRESTAPAADQATHVGSVETVSEGTAVAAVAAQAATAGAQQEPLVRDWGWVGAVAAAVVAGGYWVLHRARVARLTQNLRRWNLKTLPSGTILSTDLDVA
jgi:hypothetical protein